MIKQEPVDINLIKSEPIDGSFSTSDIVSEFLGTAVSSGCTTSHHETMDEDLPAPVTLQLNQEKGPGGVSWTSTETRSTITSQESSNINQSGTGIELASNHLKILLTNIVCLCGTSKFCFCFCFCRMSQMPLF